MNKQSSDLLKLVKEKDLTEGVYLILNNSRQLLRLQNQNHVKK